MNVVKLLAVFLVAVGMMTYVRLSLLFSKNKIDNKKFLPKSKTLYINNYRD